MTHVLPRYDYAQLPDDLKELCQWVVWKRIVTPKNVQKVPYNARIGTKASTTNPQHWCTFDEACAAYEDPDEGYAGIGFVFVQDGGIFGFDADHMFNPDTKDIHPDARHWLDQFGTYVEVSQGGDGLHGIGRGTLPGDGKHRPPFEVYDQGRFFAMTGRRVLEYPATLALVNGALTDLWVALGGSLEPPAPPAPQRAVGADIPDDVLLERMYHSASGPAIYALMHGDTRAYAMDDSSADLALCNYLAWWTNKGIEQMDRLFRSSGLYRDKWDSRRGHSTYGHDTMLEAIAKVSGGYEPLAPPVLVSANGHAAAAVEPGETEPPDESNDEESEDDDEDEESGTGAMPASLAKAGPNLTDLGNAQRLINRYGENLRYTPEWGWLGWTGKYWKRDPSGIAHRFAGRVITDMYVEARTLRRRKLTKLAKDLNKWAFMSEGSSRIDAMVHQAKYDARCTADVDAFDQDPWILTCDNGVVDLRTGELRPFNRLDFVTQISRVPYEPHAASPMWDAFLEKVLPDPEVRAFLQRFAGYTLTGLTDEQCLVFLYGAGSNGKSTVLSMLQKVLGSFAMQTPPETLMVKPKGSSAIPNDIAALAGRRMVTTIEMEDGKRLAESLIKSLTGQDHITARFLHKEYFSFQPAFKVWLAANHKPEIRGTDYAIWRRIHLVPFDVQISEAERRAAPTFKSDLLAEASGVLRWCVEGCLAWQAIGLQPPAAITEATEHYRQEMDVVGPFLDECCATGTGLEVFANTLYDAFCQWCDDNAGMSLKQHTFGRKLSDRGLTRARSTGGRHRWGGLTLKPEYAHPPRRSQSLPAQPVFGTNSDPSDPSD